MGVRRLDHVNFLASDVAPNAAFTREVLGARPTEQIVLDTGRLAAQWLTFTNKSYDIVYTEDWSGSRGRLHHIAFATDTREDILRAAAVGWTSGMGRFGAVFGPWLGGRLVANEAQDWGFIVFAATALFATVMIGLTGLRSVRGTSRSGPVQPVSTAG